MLGELVPEYAKFIMKDDRMVVKLDKAFYGCTELANLWYQHLNGTLEKLEFMPTPAECCCLNHGVGDKQRTVIVYLNDILETCKDETTTAYVIEALQAKYHDVHEHMGVKHSHLGMSLGLSVTGV